jgi:hypothetical protein
MHLDYAAEIEKRKTPGSKISGSRHIVTFPAANEESHKLHHDSFSFVGPYCALDFLPFGIPCEGGWWPFYKLDHAWKTGYRPLMEAYEKLAKIVTSNDILIAAGGSMMHPEFVKQLPSYNVFICGDDPDSSHTLSQPAAPAFDWSFTFNIACVEDYKKWGCKNADWIFIPPAHWFVINSPTEIEMLNPDRFIDTVMFCERVYGISDRAQRIEALMNTFPQTVVRGQGWPGGFVSNEEMVTYYKYSKIGWNLHNSLGPTNSRLYALPLMGLLQICDNKSNLGKIFELDKEVVGFDSIQECLDKTRYYLDHEEERKEIAYNGWKRVKEQYCLEKYYTYIHDKIAEDVLRKRALGQ